MPAYLVHATWRALSAEWRQPPPETSVSVEEYGWARRMARHLCCLAGTRYVTLADQDGWVLGDWDTYTNRWRDYPAAPSVES